MREVRGKGQAAAPGQTLQASGYTARELRRVSCAPEKTLFDTATHTAANTDFVSACNFRRRPGPKRSRHNVSIQDSHRAENLRLHDLWNVAADMFPRLMPGCAAGLKSTDSCMHEPRHDA
jgi:hypothetical protein